MVNQTVFFINEVNKMKENKQYGVTSPRYRQVFWFLAKLSLADFKETKKRIFFKLEYITLDF